MPVEQTRIRNFCIIAHIDHGKSTLADRLLEFTHTIDQRAMVAQVLDSMDLEREKGITIKARAVQMHYTAQDGENYELNLIDTPGHVDFAYEVSRSLAACEGALLVVDAVQGVEAQTLANLYLALEHDLMIVPVVNKIDLPSADPPTVSREIEDITGIPVSDVILASAKEGVGTLEVLEAVVKRVPPPAGQAAAPLRALIFDSHYDPHKGVVAYVRVVDGAISSRSRIHLMASRAQTEILELGVFRPDLTPVKALTAGEVGYVATGLKEVAQCQVGDTITLADNPATQPLPGYRPVKPMVFAGIYPVETSQHGELRDALEKLRLNDAALSFQPESSIALGFGFRCGFLGLLHMEIVQERIEREYDLDIIITAPSVECHVLTHQGDLLEVRNPSDMPPAGDIEQIEEPWMKVSIVTPSRYIGAIMELMHGHRGEYDKMEYLDPTRVLLTYAVPLSELIVDFYDQLKTSTQGYASMDYSFESYRTSELVKLEILVNQEPVDALSIIVHEEQAHAIGKALVERLRKVIPRQMFEVPLQAAIGSRIVARENIAAMRKNVLAKCYGGDVTRKRKLLEKQAEGKKRMKTVGRVEIPQEAFLTVLRTR